MKKRAMAPYLSCFPVGVAFGSADAGPFAHFDPTQVDLVVSSDHGHLVFPLNFVDGPLGNQQGPFLGVDQGPGLGKLPGAQDIAGIGKEGGHFNGTGALVHLAVRKGDPALMGKELAVGQGQFEAWSFPVGLAPGFGFPGIAHILLFAQGNVDFNGINRGHGGQFGTAGLPH